MQYQKTIKVPVYNFDCTIVISDDLSNVIQKEHKRQKLAPFEGSVHGYAMGTNTAHKYLLFYAMESLCPNIVCHEVSHLVDYVFADRSDDPIFGEPRAYLTGYISEEIFNFIENKKIPLRKWPQVQKETKKWMNTLTSVPNPSLSLPKNNN